MFDAFVVGILNASKSAAWKDHQMITRFVVTFLEAGWTTGRDPAATALLDVYEQRLIESAHGSISFESTIAAACSTTHGQDMRFVDALLIFLFFGFHESRKFRNTD